MTAKKTLPQREKELQSLLVTAEGRGQLEELESRYSADGGKLRPEGASVITYILVHERECGMIVN